MEFRRESETLSSQCNSLFEDAKNVVGLPQFGIDFGDGKLVFLEQSVASLLKFRQAIKKLLKMIIDNLDENCE